MSSPTNLKLRVQSFFGVNNQDNGDTYASADRQGGLLVSQLNLPLYNAAVRGNLFHGMSVTAGHVAPADDATAPTYAVFNPAGSGVNIVPVRFRLGTITLGTRVVSALGFNIVTGLSSAAATGTKCTAFASTPTAIKNADFTTASKSKVLFSNAGTVTVTATTDFYATGLHYDLATTGQSCPVGEIKFDGDWIVPPGTLIFPAFHAAASGSTYLMQLTWMEIPIV
jgi:hypothetical protein